MAQASLYQRIKDHIVQGVESGRWKPGDRLPSESELVVSFGVARMTVNRALRELTDQGRVRRVAGVGSFVAEPRAQGTLLRIASIAADIRSRGHVHECRVLVAQAEPLPVEQALAMQLEPGAIAYHSECVHLENGSVRRPLGQSTAGARFPRTGLQPHTAGRLPGGQRALRRDRACRRCRAADPRTGPAFGDGAARALSAATAAHLVPKRDRHAGALLAPGFAL